MPKLILTRHGLTDFNAERRYQGQSDIPLNTVGLAQAADLGRRLASMKLDAAYCSDLQRAARTAAIALQAHPSGLQATPTPLLREVNGGEFEGLIWEEIIEKYPQQSHEWRANRAEIAPPGGENLTQVQARLNKALAEIIENHPGEDQNILLVVHGGVIGTLLCHFMGMDLNRIWQWRTDTCSITIVDIYKEGAILSLFNDTAHVEKSNEYAGK
ncbi:MAG TPA: histidine phosphatase family protein [Chloroflexia bacterium]|nr:histidine phosphatase family protein [Chloroflexia bacterium]